LTDAQVKVALALSLRTNGKTGACHPSKECLQADTRLSEFAVRNAVKALAYAGLLAVTVSNGRSSNRYRLTLPTPFPETGFPATEFAPTPFPETPNPVSRNAQPRFQELPEQGKEQGKEHSLLSGLRPTAEGRVSLSDVEDLIGHLNAKAGTRFEVRTATGKLTSGAEAARQRIAEHGLERMKAVIDAKAAQWLGTDQATYLRPATLFRRSNAENYVGQLGLSVPKGNGTRPPAGGPDPTGAAYRPFPSFD